MEGLLNRGEMKIDLGFNRVPLDPVRKRLKGQAGVEARESMMLEQVVAVDMARSE